MELLWDPGVTRNCSGISESTGTPCSRSNPERRFPVVTQNSVFRNHPELFETPESPGTHSGFRNRSGKPESPGNLPRSRNNREIWVSRVTRNSSEIPESPGTLPGFRSHSETRVPRVNGNSGFHESSGTTDSHGTQSSEVTRRTQGSRSHSGDYRFPESPRTAPGSQRHGNCSGILMMDIVVPEIC